MISILKILNFLLCQTLDAGCLDCQTKSNFEPIQTETHGPFVVWTVWNQSKYNFFFVRLKLRLDGYVTAPNTVAKSGQS